jgi:hypothetical protein
LIGFAGDDCNNGTVLSRGIVVIPGTFGFLLLHDIPSPRDTFTANIDLEFDRIDGAGLHEARRRFSLKPGQLRSFGLNLFSPSTAKSRAKGQPF